MPPSSPYPTRWSSKATRSRPRSSRSTPRSPSSTATSGWVGRWTTAAGTWWTTRSRASAARRCSTVGGWSTAPRRWTSRRAPQAALNVGTTEIAFLEPGLVHQAARGIAHLLRPRLVGARLPRRRAEPHAVGSEPRHHHRLQRRGPRGQRLRPGQLLEQRLRVAAAGAVLDRAAQHRLLTGTTPMTMSVFRRVGLPALLLGVTAACGLLDTDTPGHRVARGGRDPGRRAVAPGGRVRRLGLHPGRRRHRVRRRRDPADRPHGRRVRAVHDAAGRAGGRPAQDLRRQRRSRTRCSCCCSAPAWRRKTRPTRCSACRPTPDEEPGIAEMLAVAGYTYISLGEDFCSGVPFSRVDGDIDHLRPAGDHAAGLRSRHRAVRRRARAPGHR